MRSGPPSSADSSHAGAAWVALAGVLVAGALLAPLLAATGALDWRPNLAWREPWRAWSAAFVHFSSLHLVANVAGAVLVAALGWVARVPWRIVLAWFAAWPLTQLGLLAQPELVDYGGLSGVLHAGVACVALYLVVERRGAQRGIGWATLAVLVAKVGSEAPWGAALRFPAGWDIAVAPFAHLSGLVSGLATAAVAEAGSHRSHSMRRDA